MAAQDTPHGPNIQPMNELSTRTELIPTERARSPGRSSRSSVSADSR